MSKEEHYMGYPTTIQLISRTKGNHWYVNFPNVLAKALDFKKGEIVEWEIVEKNKLLVTRTGKTNKTRARKRTDKEAFD